MSDEGKLTEEASMSPAGLDGPGVLSVPWVQLRGSSWGTLHLSPRVLAAHHSHSPGRLHQDFASAMEQ